MLNVVFQRMEAGSSHVVVPPIMVSDLLGLPPADASNMSAFVQQFLADVVATVDPFGTVAQHIQEVGHTGTEGSAAPASGSHCKGRVALGRMFGFAAAQNEAMRWTMGQLCMPGAPQRFRRSLLLEPP